MIGRIGSYALNFVYLLVLLIVSPWIVFRAMRTGRYRAGWGQRLLGFAPRNPTESETTIWLHAVSVGEIQQLRPLVAGLQRRYPRVKLYISTTTDSGMALAASAFPDATRFYFPLDFTWSVKNAIRRVRPDLLVFIELEVWPNMVLAAKQLGCPVVIVNGRLSESSFRGYRRIRFLLQPIFSKFDWVGTQDETYRDRFLSMGVPHDRLINTGNLKFDGAESDRCHPEIALRREQIGLQNDDMVWVGGSTQSPEERYLIESFQQLKTAFPRLRLILVPRHPERFDEVAKWLDESNLEYRRRSKGHEIPMVDWQVLLGDTVGELRWWWGMADIAFVGGSFGDRGGQNMIEPAAFGVSTAVGPNTKNFEDTMGLLKAAEAIVELQTPEDLVDWAKRHLSNREYRESIGTRASQTVALHRGALEATLDCLSPLLLKTS
jgi:3-deoxy-D-manno-octulosonic-acid transferase